MFSLINMLWIRERLLTVDAAREATVMSQRQPVMFHPLFKAWHSSPLANFRPANTRLSPPCNQLLCQMPCFSFVREGVTYVENRPHNSADSVISTHLLISVTLQCSNLYLSCQIGGVVCFELIYSDGFSSTESSAILTRVYVTFHYNSILLSGR